jgi:hypothetical protein
MNEGAVISQNEQKEIFDVNSTTSNRKGFSGVLESLMRKFRTFFFTLFLAPIAALYILCMGVALLPGISLFQIVSDWSQDFSFLIRNLLFGFSLSAGFFLYGMTLIFIVPAVNKLLPLKVRPHRATWYSLSVIPWYYHNALTYLVRYTFLDLITPTPFNKLFYQMMGMKIGKGSVINTSNISDPCLIEIGDYVTIGGSVTLVAHYGQKGLLVIDRLVIKDKATIGLRASLFGNVVVGRGALVKAHEVLMPKTRIPDEY